MIPSSSVDLFSDALLEDPYERLRELRDLGPVVYLEAQDVFAVTRYHDVRHVLRSPEQFCSGQGVGLNDFINEVGRGTTLMSDGAEHRRLRAVIGRPLSPKALSALSDEAQGLADRLVAELVEARSIDAVSDLAEVLPTSWVPDLLGWPIEGRERLLSWAAATFDCLGPLNDRTIAAGADLSEMIEFAFAVAASSPPEGSMAAGVIAAAARGELEVSQCPNAIVDCLGPSLDTTIAGLGNAIWLFASNPEQWEILQADPSRVKQAFNEVLRMESPVSAFTRVATESSEIDGVRLPEAARLLVSFTSANRDERRWEEPDAFDVMRSSAGQLGFGYGEHVCVGMGLARLESHALLTALAARVRTLELAGTPRRRLNNMIRSFAELPVVLTPR